MNYVNIRSSWFGHFKQKKLEKMLGAGGVMGLIKLWYHAAAGRKNGVFIGADAGDLKAGADWKGEPGLLVSTLLELKLLDLNGDTYAIHDWLDHNRACRSVAK